jgi:rhodanese-related sulfurtransferase
VRALVPDPTTMIVVNCAGRTRSILGAQTLRNFGVPNPIYALENGTQGWVLADLELDRGATRKYPEVEHGPGLAELQRKARALADRHGVGFVDAGQVRSWLDDSSRNVYLCDVRTPEEFAAGSIDGAQHTPGGQFIQATDQHVGVRNARIVVFDAELVRAPVVASWLAQMGHRVAVLEQGVKASLRGLQGPRPALPSLTPLAPAALPAFMQTGRLLDLRSSAAFRDGHVRGARWSIRPRIAAHADGATPIALTAGSAETARLAALDLYEAGARDVRIVDDGIEACRAAGLPIVKTPDEPADRERIDFLFFVHDRHAGNKAAMRGYLQWETGLVQQLDATERSSYRLPAEH